MVHGIGGVAAQPLALSVRPAGPAVPLPRHTPGDAGPHAAEERFNGARGQGFAFGKRIAAPATDPAPPAAGPGGVATAQAAAGTAAGREAVVQVPVQTAPQGQQSGDDTDIQFVLGEGPAPGPSKGVDHFEAGQTLLLYASDHTGAKYAISGLEDGTGIRNVHNIKGYFVLDSGKPEATGAVPEFPVDKVSEFLKKRGEIADKARSAAPASTKAAEKQDKAFVALFAAPKPDVSLAPPPTAQILDIRDGRFDAGKFTGRQALSLQIAANIGTRGKPDFAPDFVEGADGPKRGPNGQAYGYGHGLALGHDGEDAPANAIGFLRRDLFA